MKAGSPRNRNVTPEQARKILSQNGIEVNEKEVEEILDFLYFLAKLSVDQYLNDKTAVKKPIPSKTFV